MDRRGKLMVQLAKEQYECDQLNMQQSEQYSNVINAPLQNVLDYTNNTNVSEETAVPLLTGEGNDIIILPLETDTLSFHDNHNLYSYYTFDIVTDTTTLPFTLIQDNIAEKSNEQQEVRMLENLNLINHCQENECDTNLRCHINNSGFEKVHPLLPGNANFTENKENECRGNKINVNVLEELLIYKNNGVDEEDIRQDDPDWMPNDRDMVPARKRGLSEVDIEDETGVNSSTLSKTRKTNKILRVLGKKYHGFKRIGDKYVVTDKDPRCLKPKTCTHNKDVPVSKTSFMCNRIDEMTRQKIFSSFWKLQSWDAKKAYLKGLVDFRFIKRRRPEINHLNTKKQFGYDCFLSDKNGIKTRVCRSFFLSTLDIKRDRFNKWLQELNEVDHSDDANEEFMGEANENNDKTSSDKRKKHPKKSDSVLTWLDLLPKVPSHYCRSSSSRIYVDAEFRSFINMHNEYKDWCTKTKLLPVQRKKFCEVLDKHKISIHKPRKDQCDVCVSFKEGNLSQEQYDLHIEKKEDARKAKENAISSACNEILVITVDAQSILTCPKLLVSSQYYKQKLQVHNLSIYVSNNKDVHLYVWHEGDGGVTSNEFTSCIIHFIKSQNNFKKIIIISDGCAYQNKNRVLASSLADLSKSMDIEIEQIILEKGHTMMEVDSVHSTLEGLFRPPIYTPLDYISRMCQARKKQPYIINHVDYTFFYNYERLPNNYTSIRPGKKSGDPTVSDIRGLNYKKGEVFYKLTNADEWRVLPHRRVKLNEIEPNRLYDQSCIIERKKFDNLQSLKPFMHKDHQIFYDSLRCE